MGYNYKPMHSCNGGLIDVSAWMCNYTHLLNTDAIIYSCSNLDAHVPNSVGKSDWFINWTNANLVGIKNLGIDFGVIRISIWKYILLIGGQFGQAPVKVKS